MTGQAGSHSVGSTMTIGGPVGDGQLSAQLQLDSSGAATLFGQVPGSVANVAVVDSTGAVLGQATANQGWFVLLLPAGAAGSAASLVARSSSGASIEAVPVGMPPQPTPGSHGLRERRELVANSARLTHMPSRPTSRARPGSRCGAPGGLGALRLRIAQRA